MPVPESDILSTLISALELFVEQAELRLGRQTTAFDASVCGEVVVRRDDRPLPRSLDRDRTIHGADL